ncbi:MAG: glycosyltransferase family 4 protein [Bacilli bacterium]|nr:glycosyltransferase family 4 protein [Bacilli bacterium]
MRVLLINHFPLCGSGSGVYTENIANSLSKLGHEICVIFPENEDVKKYNFKTHPVYFNEESLDFNFPCFTTHPRSSKTFYELTDDELIKYLNAFEEAIREEITLFKPDIIHAGHIWLLADLAASFDIPLVITAHGTDLIGYETTDRFRKNAVNAAKRAKHIITISKENEKKVGDIFPFAKRKIINIPNGYNPDVFYRESLDKEVVLRELGFSKKYDKVVGFVGKFTYFKGIDVLLRAAAKYEREDTVTILAGSGELFDEMESLSQKLNLKNVKFIGNQPHSVLRRLYNIFDVSLVPSRSEAFGLVVIEAMACGCPVIGTNDGGIKDIITDKTGILIDTDDFEALASNVTSVLNGDIVFDRNVVADYANEKYSQDNFTKKLLKVYKKSM